MKLNDLRPDKGAKHRKRRVGRGTAAGQGKTSGRGTKGHGARKGGKKRAYFEGGQMPLVRKLPFKRGFSSLFRIYYAEVNVDQLDETFKKGDQISAETLAAKGMIPDASLPVVVLGRGETKKAFKLQVHRISESARTKIEGAGGSVELLDLGVTGARRTIKKLSRQKLAEAIAAPKAEA